MNNWDLIIVDDHSTDRSAQVIGDWLSKENRIVVTFLAKREGMGKTLNDAIRLARGMYLMPMASDDMLRRDAFQKAVCMLERNMGYDVAILEGETMDEADVASGALFSQFCGREPSIGAGYFFDDLLEGNFVYTGVIRRQAIERHRIQFEESMKYLNDWLFWLDLSAVCKFICIGDPLYHYRVHPANAIANMREADYALDDTRRKGIGSVRQDPGQQEKISTPEESSMRV